MQISDLIYIGHLWEFVAAFLAGINYKKFKGSKEKYFLHFLWFTLIIDLIGDILGDFYEVENYFIYNLYMLVSFPFFYYWYFSILQKRIHKTYVIMFSSVFLLTAFWNLIDQSWEVYHKYTFVTGALFTLTCAIFHFWQLLNSDEVLEVKYKLSFWISTGLLLFNMGMIPFMLLSEYFDFSSNAYYFFVIIGLNLILYGCYSLGFLWTKEKYNRS